MNCSLPKRMLIHLDRCLLYFTYSDPWWLKSPLESLQLPSWVSQKWMDYLKLFYLAFFCPTQKWYQILQLHHFRSQIQGPARNGLMLYCANWAHASLSLGKEELLSASPGCSAYPLLSRALSSRSLMHSCHGLPPPWTSAHLSLVIFFVRWLQFRRMERGGSGLEI